MRTGKLNRSQSVTGNMAGNTVLLFVLMMGFSVFAAITVYNGSVSGAGMLMVLLIGIPVLFGIVVSPPFALCSLLVAAYCIMWVLRMGLVDFPLGTLMDGLEALILVTFFFRQYKRPDWSFISHPVTGLIFAWLIYCMLLVLNPIAPSQLAWLYSYRTMAMAMLMYLAFVYFVNNMKVFRAVIITWLAMSVFAAFYAIKQEYLGFAAFEEAALADPLVGSLLFIDGHWRKFSIFGDPVAFSYNMVVSSLLCIAMMVATRSMFKKLLLAGMVLLFWRVMLFSGTRGSYVLLPAAIAFYFILNFRLSMIPLMIVAALVMIVLIKMPTSNPTLYRFQTAFRPDEDASFNVRAQNQAKIRPYIWSHPFGGGMGAAGASGARFAPGSFLATFPPDSGYVRFAVETGWIGLLLFCIMVTAILITGVKNYFSIQNKELKAYCLGMLLTIFVLNVGNYPQEAIIQFPTNIIFYASAALIIAAKRIDNTLQQNAARQQPPAVAANA